MTRAEIMDWKPGSHASTFGGNPVCIAAAHATLDIIEREAMANSETIGNLMLARLHNWVSTHKLVGEVRGRGLMIGLEIVADKATRQPAPALRDKIVDIAFQKGLLILGCGETSLPYVPAAGAERA